MTSFPNSPEPQFNILDRFINKGSACETRLVSFLNSLPSEPQKSFPSRTSNGIERHNESVRSTVPAEFALQLPTEGWQSNEWSSAILLLLFQFVVQAQCTNVKDHIGEPLSPSKESQITSRVAKAFEEKLPVTESNSLGNYLGNRLIHFSDPSADQIALKCCTIGISTRLVMSIVLTIF